MKGKFCIIVSLLVCFPVFCPAADSDSLTSMLNIAKSALSINENTILKYLDWETQNTTLTADMINTTESQGRTTTANAKIYKMGSSFLRMDMEPKMLQQQSTAGENIGNFYIIKIKNLKEKTTFFVFPQKKAYIEPDPEESQETIDRMKGKLKEILEQNPEAIKTIEKKGIETIEGIPCEKIHLIVELQNGTVMDINTCLAKQYQNFPVKTILQSTTPRGIKIINRTLFKNLTSTKLDEGLFQPPAGFTKYKNLVELATGGQYSGERIKKIKERIKRRRKRR